ncbi:MAG: hypothetical protein K0U74_15270 [Alphaproteobacteria bacterium]|nr:hypothetical protein [Alphaproteobacteria bacterium]
MLFRSFSHSVFKFVAVFALCVANGSPLHSGGVDFCKGLERALEAAPDLTDMIGPSVMGSFGDWRAKQHIDGFEMCAISLTKGILTYSCKNDFGAKRKSAEPSFVEIEEKVSACRDTWQVRHLNTAQVRVTAFADDAVIGRAVLMLSENSKSTFEGNKHVLQPYWRVQLMVVDVRKAQR